MLLAVDRITIKRAICIPDIDRVYFQLVWCGEVVPDVMMSQLDGPSFGDISAWGTSAFKKKNHRISFMYSVPYRRSLQTIFSGFIQ